MAVFMIGIESCLNIVIFIKLNVISFDNVNVQYSKFVLPKLRLGILDGKCDDWPLS